ncbi:MAG: DUF5979 domain-containing protein [Firmicutes bacterium]|nr:DUF5979 domain-containing protein [Bacillota bacterium]
MDAREDRHALRRILVTLLVLTLVLSVCFPAFQARAEDTSDGEVLTEATEFESVATEAAATVESTSDTEAEPDDITNPVETPPETDPGTYDQNQNPQQEADPLQTGDPTEPTETEASEDTVPTEEEVSSEIDDEETMNAVDAAEFSLYAMGNELDPNSYRGTSKVYWDTMNNSENGSYGGTKDARIASVRLNNTDVVWGNSNATSWSGGTALSTYFPGATASGSTDTMRNASLVITPAAGYYVTKIVIACVDPQAHSPYSCHTWAAGNAFVANFSVGTSGAAAVTVSSLDFSHRSRSANYFILIKLAPVPTPLYVEYDSGTVGGMLSGNAQSVFAQRDAWTSGSGSNNYGTGGVQSEYTQYQYAYAGESSQAAGWKHYANTVTPDAKREAAQLGYYFTGWKVEYYTHCTAQEQSNPAPGENRYVYSFSGSYGTGSAGEGTEVPLTTNCRIIAQWAPVTLTIVKETEGITGSHTFGLTLYREGEQVGEEHMLTVSGSAAASTAVSPVVPGTYTIQETSGGGNLTVDGTTLYHTLRYEPQQLTITTDSILQGTTHYELKAINTYTQAKPMLKFTKVWKNSDGTALSGDSSLLPDTVSFTITGRNGYSGSVTLRKADGWSAVMEVPEGEEIAGLTVTENSIPGFRQVEEIAVSEQADEENQLVYTVYTATNQLCVASITVQKTVTGNMGDRTKPFSFQATVDGDPFGEPFTLTNGEKTTIENVPIGSVVVITETGNAGYEFSAEVTNTDAETVSGSTVTFSVSPEGNCVTITNRKEALIDTGVPVDFIPQLLLLIVGAIGLAAGIAGKRRDWQG